MEISLKLISRVFLIIFAYLLLTNFVSGIYTFPSEGDSIYYHIPIAENILDGNFILQKNIIGIGPWFPGSSEGILSLFILFHIPLNLFNVFAIFIFFIVLYKFAKIFIQNDDLSLIFSSSVASAYGVFRLAHTQNIDIWMAIFFLILMILLENPKNTIFYFILLGFFSGMLIGSKYTGPLFFFILMVFYIKDLLEYGNMKRIIVFLIPFSIFGLFWYFRNFALTGSPFYPQSILFFKGLPGWNSYLSIPMWRAFILTPKLVFNAFISEFMIWPVLFFLIPLFLLYLEKTNKKYLMLRKFKRILFISILIFFIYLFLPYDKLYLGMVLSMRYIFNLFSLLVLLMFLIAKYFKAERIFSIVILSSYLTLFIQPYHPKLIFIYTPVVFVLFLLLFHRKKIISNLFKLMNP